MSDIPTKRCTKCGEEFPATSEFFNRNKWRPDGLQEWCSKCRSEHRRTPDQIEKRRAKAQTDAFKAKKREWDKGYRERHLDQVREYDRQRNSTPERKQYNREWNSNNAEWRKQYRRMKYWSNPDRFRTQKRADHEKNKAHRNTNYRIRYQVDPEFREIKRETNRRALKRYYATEHGKLHHKAHSSLRRARMLHVEGTHTAADIQAQLKRQKGRCYYAACGHAKLGDKYHVEHVVPLGRGGSNDPSNIVISCPSCNLSKHTKLPHEWPEGGRLL